MKKKVTVKKQCECSESKNIHNLETQKIQKTKQDLLELQDLKGLQDL